MNRWKVKQIYSHFYDRGMWEVHNTEGIYGSYLTHAEAIADADRMARTVQIELPQVSDTTHLPAHTKPDQTRPSGYYTVTTEANRVYAIEIWSPWGSMGIYRMEDAKPLALALLALHYKQEQT